LFEHLAFETFEEIITAQLVQPHLRRALSLSILSASPTGE